MPDQPVKANSAPTNQPGKAWRKPSVRSLKAVSATSQGNKTGRLEADLNPDTGFNYRTG